MITNSDIANLIEYLDYKLPVDGPIVLTPNISNEIEDIYFNWRYYQYLLKIAAYINQDTLCICGLPLRDDIQLHHALITKRDVQGLVDKEFIHSSFNVIVIHGENCHERATRQMSFEFLSKIYGKLNVKNWYDNQNSKLKMRLRNLE